MRCVHSKAFGGIGEHTCHVAPAAYQVSYVLKAVQRAAKRVIVAAMLSQQRDAMQMCTNPSVTCERTPRDAAKVAETSR